MIQTAGRKRWRVHNGEGKKGSAALLANAPSGDLQESSIGRAALEVTLEVSVRGSVRGERLYVSGVYASEEEASVCQGGVCK